MLSIWFPTSCGTHWCMPISKSGWNVHASGCSKVTANSDKLIYTHSPKHAHIHPLSCCKVGQLIVSNQMFHRHTHYAKHRQQQQQAKLDKQSQNINISWQLQLFRLNCDALFPFLFFFFLAAGGNQATKLTSFPQKDKANGRRRAREGGTEWHERKALAMLSFPFLSVSAVNFGQHLKQMRWWAKV